MHSDEIFELKNVDPEDVSDVLSKIEKSFCIQFADGELNNVKTFGEMCDIITAKIEGENKNDCTSQQAFYKLRNALAANFLVSTKCITPKTDLLQLLPKQNRKKNIRIIERKLGFKLNLLRPKIWVLTTLTLLLFVCFISFFINWKWALGGVMLFLIGTFIANRFANEIDAQTVGELTKKIERENYRKVRRYATSINKNEIGNLIRTLFAEELFLDEAVLNREATFN